MAISLAHPLGLQPPGQSTQALGPLDLGPAIQHILNKRGFGTRFDRWLRLEQKVADEGIELSDEAAASETLPRTWASSSTERT